MTIFGKPLSQYAEFCKPFLVLVPVAGIVRLALSLGGVPNSTAKWISVTALVGIGVLYYAVRVHASGFGSYKQLLVVSVLLNLAAQVVIIFGIVRRLSPARPISIAHQSTHSAVTAQRGPTPQHICSSELRPALSFRGSSVLWFCSSRRRCPTRIRKLNLWLNRRSKT